MSVNLSTSQLLNFIQCPRRFWLEQYHPEHEGDVASMDAFLDADEAARGAAREALRGEGVIEISGHLGLRKAIEQTSGALRDGAVILDATFEFDGVCAHIDVLDWSHTPYRAISVAADTELTARQIHDCALKAWTLQGLGLPEHRFYIASPAPSANAGDRFDDRFRPIDVTEQVCGELPRLDSIVLGAREQHAALELPEANVAPRCRSDYDCPFLEFCESR